MKKTVFFTTAMLVLAASLGATGSLPDAPHGATLYRKHCAGCHQSVRSFKQAPDFVGLIRNPPSPMPAFGPDKLSDGQAKAISDYVRFFLSLNKAC